MSQYFAKSFGSITIPLRYITTPILKALCVGSITLMLAFELDSYFYQRNVFIFWNFLKVSAISTVSLIFLSLPKLPYPHDISHQFNMSQSSLYGAHPWHWYFSQGLPAILGILLTSFFLNNL